MAILVHCPANLLLKTFHKSIDLKFLFIYSLPRVTGSSLYDDKERVKMYHSHFRGTHGEIGFRWGSLLLRHKSIILDNIPFEITQERIDFALSCIPIVQKYFPDILDEIQGIAEGQKCDVQLLQAILFSMYAMPPACHCSCFAIKNDHRIMLGKNSDFLTDMEKLNLNVIYRFDADSYSFTGNTTAIIEMEDGVNEYGLAVGLTFIYPQDIIPGFNAGMLVRYLLEKCKTVKEAISFLKEVPIASNQTITLADSIGDIVVVECNSQKVVIIDPLENENFVVATNNFNSLQMKKYFHYNIDDWNSSLRNQVANQTLKTNHLSKKLVFEILSGKHGFMCQYDRKKGADTVWSVVYDLKNKKIYRVEGNPSRKKYKEDKRFKFLY